MSLRFPVIDSKKNLGTEDEDYNFVNKDKKKKPTTSGQSLELIQDLKRKIDEQKKEIQNRNITIQGLQRNFQSLSLIVKNQKATSLALREQLDNYKKNQSSNDKRATQFHEMYIISSNELKKVKQQHEKLKRAHLNCGQYLVLSQRLKNQIVLGQQKYQKILSRLAQMDSEKMYLKEELNKLRLSEEQRVKQVKINERLKEELEKQKQRVSKFDALLLLKDEQLSKLNSKLMEKDKISNFSQQKAQRLVQKISTLQKQVQRFQTMLQRSNKENEELRKISENKQLFNKLKIQEQEKLRRQIALLTTQIQESRRQSSELSKELERNKNKLQEKETMLIDITLDLNRENKVHQLALDQFASKQQEYLEQLQKIKQQTRQLSDFVQKLTGEKFLLQKENQAHYSSHGDKVGQLNRQLNQISSSMNQIQRKYGSYLKLIDQNGEVGSVVITNSRQIQKMTNRQQFLRQKLSQSSRELSSIQQKHEITSNYIKSLESQLQTKNQQILNLTRKLHKFQLQQEQLNRILQTQKQKLSSIQDEKSKSKMQFEQKLKQKDIQLEKQKRQLQQAKRTQQQKQLALKGYQDKLYEYERQERELKKLMQSQKMAIQDMKRQKQLEIQQMIFEKQSLIEKQKKNNKILWEDNKKLKEYQQSLKRQAEKQISQLQSMKELQLQRLKRQMQAKLMNIKSSTERQSESNSNELKKILIQKSTQMKIITQNYNQLQSENQKIRKQLTKFLEQTEFYKNRNKEIQTLLERVEKTYKEKLSDAQKQSKSYKQVVSVYEKKEKKALKDKQDAEQNLKNIQNQLLKLKKKYQGQKIQEKLALIKNTITDFELSLKTLLNTFSCNYCVQVVQDCVRLQECGHIYCKKCKAGYEPNCGQCKSKSKAKPDKNINESVSKAEYMKILLNTIKDDIHKINL